MDIQKENGMVKDFDEIFLPISIFTNGASGLESISKYLKEIKGLRYCAIAEILG